MKAMPCDKKKSAGELSRMNGNILDMNVIIRIIKDDNAVAEQVRKGRRKPAGRPL